MKLQTLKLGTCLLLLAVAAAARGQQPPPAPDRFGIAANPDSYPQATPKQAMGSALAALDKGRVEYFAAQLLDPAFSDGRVAARAAGLELAVEREYLALRDSQRGTVTAANRLPNEPEAFAAAVSAEARRRAFRLFVRDIRATLAESPDHLRDLRRFEASEYTEAGDTAKATLPDVKDRGVFFRRVDGRWYVLDGKTEPPPPAPAK